MPERCDLCNGIKDELLSTNAGSSTWLLPRHRIPQSLFHWSHSQNAELAAVSLFFLVSVFLGAAALVCTLL